MTRTTTDSPTAFGADWNPYTPDELRDPYPFYARARREAPAFFSPHENLWVLTRYNDVFAALYDPHTFSSRNTRIDDVLLADEARAILGPGGLYPAANAVATDPPQHARLRAALEPGFGPDRLAGLEPQIRGIAHQLVDQMTAAGNQADLVGAFASALPFTVVLLLFGVGQERIPDFQRWTRNLIELMTPVPDAQAQVAAAHGVAEYHEYVHELLAEKRAHPGPDITSDLVHYRNGASMTEDELVSTLTGLLFAAHPTVMCLIGNSALLFLNPRSRWEAMLADRALVGPAVEEVVRYEAPVPTVIRRTTSDVVVGGETIPAGSRVLLVFSSANRDETHYDEPDEFRPGRYNVRDAFTFAEGPHICAGRYLARLEGRIAFEVLLERLPGLRLVENQPLNYLPTLVIRGLAALPVAWD
jgi:cytochrome P450